MKHLGQKRIPILDGVNSVKAEFIAEDFMLIAEAIGKIEVKGQEVKIFIEVQQYIQKVKKMISDAEMELGESIYVELPVNVGNNILLFMNRVSLDNNEAEKFQRFVNSIIKATQNALNNKKN